MTIYIITPKLAAWPKKTRLAKLLCKSRLVLPNDLLWREPFQYVQFRRSVCPRKNLSGHLMRSGGHNVRWHNSGSGEKYAVAMQEMQIKLNWECRGVRWPKFGKERRLHMRRITKSLLSRCGQFKGRITELQVIAPIYDLKVYAHVQLVVFGTLLCKSQLREI